MGWWGLCARRMVFRRIICPCSPYVVFRNSNFGLRDWRRLEDIIMCARNVVMYCTSYVVYQSYHTFYSCKVARLWEKTTQSCEVYSRHVTVVAPPMSIILHLYVHSSTLPKKMTCWSLSSEDTYAFRQARACFSRARQLHSALARA